MYSMMARKGTDFDPNLVEGIAKVAIPLSKEREHNYQNILEAVGDAQIVMIGEASHGTKEFYEQRAEITKRLIRQKGFCAVAVEADWPDAYRVNRYVQKGKTCRDKTAEEALEDFKRFPMWMWRNTVVQDFVEWLHEFNDSVVKKEDKIAFYGMDLYSFYSSMDAVVEYLQQVSPKDAEAAKKAYSRFERFQGEPSSYGFSAGLGVSQSLEKEVVKTLNDLRIKGEEYLKGVGGLIDGDELFYAQQNAQLVKNAEEYYRKMYHADEHTWNIRDKHMADCIESLIAYHAKKQGSEHRKMVLWAHNSHLGDAKYTDASRRGEWNVGQLVREKYGMSKTFNIGFSTYTGTVTAADQWDDPGVIFDVNPGMSSSYEELFHRVAETGNKDYVLLMRTNNPKMQDMISQDIVSSLSVPRLERYIGVIYRPDTERASHYAKSHIAKEFDCVIYIDETSALPPLDGVDYWKKGVKLGSKKRISSK